MEIVISSIFILMFLGILISLFLGISSKIFYVEVDDRIQKVREILPGNNCGGCGYAGCDSLAEAIVSGNADVSSCTVGGESVADAIANLLNKKNVLSNKKVAIVHCDGSCKNVKKLYEYKGLRSCKILSHMPNQGDKMCKYACIGCGDCVKVCKFDAIHIIDGVAVVDEEKCTNCKKCIEICPKKIIDLKLYNIKTKVLCSSKDHGKIAKDICSVSCIGCKICEKNCEVNAIIVKDNLAVIDYNNCIDCGICSEKCPRKCIKKNID